VKLAWNWQAIEVAAVPLQPEIVDPDTADQCEHRSDLDSVFDRSGEGVEMAVSNVGLHSAVEAGSRIKHGNRIERVGVRITLLGKSNVIALT
jgi:hypothetical protein